MTIWPTFKREALRTLSLFLIVLSVSSLLHIPMLRAEVTAQQMGLKIIATAPAIATAEVANPALEKAQASTSPLDAQTPLFDRFAQVQVQVNTPQPTGDPYLTANADAQIYVNSTLWGAIGCLLGILGVAAAFIIPPTPPATAIIGQPAEYVTAYTYAYQEAGKKAQGKASIIGCVIGSAVTTVLYLVAIAGTAAAASTY